MKRALFILFFAGFATGLLGQETSLVKGVVSYVSSQHVYVKFESTEYIKTGDTLFSNITGAMAPALVVNNKSSVSCVCIRMTAGQAVKVNDEFFARVLIPAKEAKAEKKKPAIVPEPVLEDSTKMDNTAAIAQPEKKAPRQQIKGRISAASYSSLSGLGDKHRMQYAFTLTGNNIGNSRFSIDNYITFRHTLGEWDAVRANLANALKVYSCAVKYDFSNTASVTLGRKINPKIASMGAVDGIQFEKSIKHFLFGALAGSRPDYTDYSVDPNLFQYGGYIGHVSGKTQKYQQSTFAFIEQRNQAKIDRRFIYFQHSNDLLKNLNMFGSFEMDLYKNIDNQAQNTLSLTNLYLSLRYKVTKNLSVSGSYDNRKNIIYYESYKSFIDRLIEDETRQGFRLSANIRLFKTISWGANTSWRFQKNSLNDSKNLNSYITFSRLPWLNASATVSANLLKTNYLDSKMFGIRLSREIVPRKLNGELNYRYVDYRYKTSEYEIQQHVAGGDLSWRISKKLSFFIYYEGTFQDQHKVYQRVNTKLIYRF